MDHVRGAEDELGVERQVLEQQRSQIPATDSSRWAAMIPSGFA